MNWDAINAISQTFGAMGVIASLVYLAVQIRQNTQATRLANAHKLQDASRETLLAVIDSSRMVDLIVKAQQIESLTLPERLMMEHWLLANVRNIEAAYTQYASGALDETAMLAWRLRARSLQLLYPEILPFRDEAHIALSREFKTWLDEVWREE